MPRLDAVPVASSDMATTVKFYSLIGFKFDAFEPDAQHVEPITEPGEVRLMIDTKTLLESILGSAPTPPNHSSFSMLCDDAAEVNTLCAAVEAAGFNVIKQPWDAFWGQRYAIVADPDGYLVDLFAPL